MNRFANKNEETEGCSASRVLGSVQTLRKLKLVGVKCVGLSKFGDLIPEAVKKMCDQLKDIPNRIHPELHFGIAPCSVSQDIQETHTYYIAVEVTDFHGVPTDLEQLEIGVNEYAIVRKDRGRDVGDIFSASWAYMQANKLKKASNDANPLAYQIEIFYESLEAYLGRVLGKTEGEFVMDLCVPLEEPPRRRL